MPGPGAEEDFCTGVQTGAFKIVKNLGTGERGSGGSGVLYITGLFSGWQGVNILETI
jgi:hypothetical protein